MKKIFQLLAIYLLYANISCSQNTNTVNEKSYQENNYKLDDSVFIDRSGRFCKIYVNNIDNKLKMFKLYADSQRSRLLIIYFTKDSIKNGPFTIYAPDGYLSTAGYFLDNQYEGKWLDYNAKGIIVKEYYYTKGVKSGIWKFFDDDGKLLREVNNQKDNK